MAHLASAPEGQGKSKECEGGLVCPCCGKSQKEREFAPEKSVDTKAKTIYSALQLDKRDIRILAISSGLFNDEIQCKLYSVSLDNNQYYTALSYCWGDAAQRGYISVNGQKISVTKSLELALRYMRHIEDNVVVWADAICINQDDPIEKSFQVTMMGDIYAKEASHAWIWLGESADNSDTAMDLVESVHEIDFRDPNFRPDPVAWSAVTSLFERPWWGRLWIVQEALLARKSTLNCGRKAVGMECFVRLKEVVSKYRRAPEERLKPMQSGLTSPFGTILSDWSRLKGLIAKGGVPLFQMVTSTGEAKCFLQIDKIFGLLSMCTAMDRQIIKADYRVCARCVVLRVAKYHMVTREHDHPLRLLQTHQADKDPMLPSWVPDYTKTDFENHLIFPASEECIPFTAGANNAAWTSLGLAPLPNMNNDLNSVTLRIEDEGTHETLLLPGLIVDVVSATYPAPFVDFYTGPDLEEDARVKRLRREAMRDACKDWLYYVRNGLCAGDDPYATTCGREEAFWRTVIADRDLQWRGPPEARDFAGRFEAWLGMGERAGDDGYIRPFSDAAIVHGMYRSFIVTRKGYLGLGRSCTRPGDMVCVLRGGLVPFVLKHRGGGYYGLVGEAYVHGIMDGSFVWGAEVEDLREFRIR